MMYAVALTNSNYTTLLLRFLIFIRYQEFVFSLPPDKMYLEGQGITNIESYQLRIAVQAAANGGQVVAMSTIGYGELKISVS